MLDRKRGTVLRILAERPGAQEIAVEIDGTEARAVNYPRLTGTVSAGDEVLLNTTAVNLGLGTGGVHFVICNLSNPERESEQTSGHVMKLRYTPLQEAVLSVEEDASPDQEKVREFESLGGMPVICCELHSQIAPASAALKALTGYQARVVYVMTDGAALPLAFSRLVSELKEKGLLDATITCGQAFGGDIEAVNLYTGLIAAKEVARTDAVIVCQGPGNAGTGSRYGFSGIQQGEAINAARILGGQPIAVARISFADPRERHRGVSHHTVTVLGEIALSPCLVALPEMREDKARLIAEKLEPALRWSMHEARVLDGEPGLAELARKDIRVTTMGRSVEEDREFFLAASAAGALAAELLEGEVDAAPARVR
jgi:hypothetical protein